MHGSLVLRGGGSGSTGGSAVRCHGDGGRPVGRTGGRRHVAPLPLADDHQADGRQDGNDGAPHGDGDEDADQGNLGAVGVGPSRHCKNTYWIVG